MTAQQNDGMSQLSYDYPVSGYCGIGIRTDSVGLKEGIRIVEIVQSPFETPARRAGLEVGDIITHYLSSSAGVWKPISQSLDVIRGPQGDPISLRVLRGRTGEPYETTLIRDVIIETPLHRDPFMELRFIPQVDSKCESLVQAPSTPAVPFFKGRMHASGR